MRTRNVEVVLMNEFSKWIEEYDNIGWDPYLLSFMFSPLSGGETAKTIKMEKAITGLYKSTLSRVVRNPHKTNHLPIWIACLDHLVYKREKVTLADATINGGLHAHAIALVPPRNRLRIDYGDMLMSHFLSNQLGVLQRVHAEAITRTPEKAAKYALKSLGRGRANSDDIIILPRSRDEL